jgi:hypothetical protein
MNIELTQEQLELACKKINIPEIKYLLENKVIPNHKCFCYLICDSDFMTHPELINILISYGYKLTYDDVVKCAEYKIEINNYDDYDFDDDGTLLRTCIESNFKPKYFSKLKVGRYNKMITEFTQIEHIKKFVNKGFKLNISGLRFICKCVDRKYISHIVKYYIEIGISPDLTCFYNLCNHPCSNSKWILIKKNLDKLNKIKISENEITDKPNELVEFKKCVEYYGTNVIKLVFNKLYPFMTLE